MENHTYTYTYLVENNDKFQLNEEALDLLKTQSNIVDMIYYIATLSSDNIYIDQCINDLCIEYGCMQVNTATSQHMCKTILEYLINCETNLRTEQIIITQLLNNNIFVIEVIILNNILTFSFKY